MARAAWEPVSMVVASAQMPGEGEEPKTVDEFNPFLVGREQTPAKKKVKPYDPERLRLLQENS